MVSTKYVKDYRMDTETDINGKVKRKMIYVGPFYVWKTPEVLLKKLRRNFLFLSLAEWLLFLGSMMFYSNISKNWYVILPYVCMILVFFFHSLAVYNLYTVKEPMQREIKDKTTERIKGANLMGVILCTASLVGELIVCLKNMPRMTGNDFVFIIATAILFVFLLFGFVSAKRLNVSEQENPVANEWKNK